MKKFQPSISSFNENRKKVLDNITDLVYNIRMDGMKTKTSENELIEVNDDVMKLVKGVRRFAKTGSDITLDAVIDKLESQTAPVYKAFADAKLSPPVLAGGAIRDTLLGISPADWDFFWHGKGSADEDLDEITYVLLSLRDTLGAVEYPYLVVSNYKGADDTVEAFDVMEMYHEVGRLFEVYQVINRKDFSTAKELIDSFDYSLVRGYYDPLLKKIFVGADFIESLATRKVFVKDEKTYHRLVNFNYKFSYAFAATGPGVPQKKKHSKYIISTTF